MPRVVRLGSAAMWHGAAALPGSSLATVGGGRRGRDLVAQRFHAWSQGDFTRLVRWWEQDRAAAHHPLDARPPADAERTVQKALRFISCSELGRAARLLTIHGVVNLADDRIVEQLRHKHPPRRAAVPEAFRLEIVSAVSFCCINFFILSLAYL